MYNARETTTLSLLFAAMAFSYMDRAAFGVLAPQLQADLQLDAAELGLVLGAFSVGYTLFTFFGGLLVDRFGAKLVLGCAMVVWSVFCAMTGLAQGFVALLAVRFCFGVAEAPAGPAVAKSVSSWFAPARYAGALGIAFAGASIGGAIAGPVAGLLAGSFGWRAAFVIIGSLGIVWLFCWIFLARDTPVESDARASRPVASVVEKAEPLGPWLTHPAVLASATGNFALGYLLYFFISWFPSYLVHELSMDLATMSIAASLPWLVGAVGVVLGGYASDHLVRRLGNEVRARKIVIVVGLGLAGVCVALAPSFATPISALALISCAKFFIFVTSPNYSALVRAAVPPRRFGAAVGVITLSANLAGIVAPIVTGFLVQWTGHYTAAFLFTGAVVVCGALATAVVGAGSRTVAPRYTGERA